MRLNCSSGKMLEVSPSWCAIVLCDDATTTTVHVQRARDDVATTNDNNDATMSAAALCRERGASRERLRIKQWIVMSKLTMMLISMKSRVSSVQLSQRNQMVDVEVMRVNVLDVQVQRSNSGCVSGLMVRVREQLKAVRVGVRGERNNSAPTVGNFCLLRRVPERPSLCHSDAATSPPAVPRNGGSGTHLADAIGARGDARNAPVPEFVYAHLSPVLRSSMLLLLSPVHHTVRATACETSIQTLAPITP